MRVGSETEPSNFNRYVLHVAPSQWQQRGKKCSKMMGERGRISYKAAVSLVFLENLPHSDASRY